MSTQTQSYRPTLTVGQVFLRIAGSAAPLRAVGNVSALDLEIQEDTKTLSDYTAAGGGTWASVSRVKEIDATLKLHDLDAANLALAQYGTAADVAAATVAAEAGIAYQGGLLRLAHPDPTAVTVTSAVVAWAATTAYQVGDLVRKTTTNGHVYKCTTAGTSGASEPTWKTDGTTTTDGTTLVWADLGLFAAASGTDYVIRPAGLMIQVGKGIPDGCPVSVAYTHGAYSVVEAMVASQQVWECVFEGLNEANSGSAVLLDIWRLQLAAAAKISKIGDDFAVLEIKGRLLKDTSKGAGKSAYYREQVV